jgi:RNA polymerase sigma-70 factor (ECF subfamily)
VQPEAGLACSKNLMPDDVERLLQAGRFDAVLERLLQLYGKKVYGMALAMLRDVGRAEEVTQETFLKAWRALPAFNRRAAVSTWLYTIAYAVSPTGGRHPSTRRRSPRHGRAQRETSPCIRR